MVRVFTLLWRESIVNAGAWTTLLRRWQDSATRGGISWLCDVYNTNCWTTECEESSSAALIISSLIRGALVASTTQFRRRWNTKLDFELIAQLWWRNLSSDQFCGWEYQLMGHMVSENRSSRVVRFAAIEDKRHRAETLCSRVDHQEKSEAIFSPVSWRWKRDGIFLPREKLVRNENTWNASNVGYGIFFSLRPWETFFSVLSHSWTTKFFIKNLLTTTARQRRQRQRWWWRRRRRRRQMLARMDAKAMTHAVSRIIENKLRATSEDKHCKTAQVDSCVTVTWSLTSDVECPGLMYTVLTSYVRLGSEFFPFPSSLVRVWRAPTSLLSQYFAPPF